MEGKQDAGELYSILCIVSTQVGLQCVLYLDLVGFPIHLPYSAIFNGVPRCSMCIPHGRIKTWKGIFCIDLPHYQYICGSLKYNFFVCPSINYCPATNQPYNIHLPGSARHAPGRKFQKKGHEYRKHFVYRNCWGPGKKWSEVNWTKKKWNEMKWNENEMKWNEGTKEWNAWKNQCKNKSMEWKERMKEWMNAWMHE